MINGLLYEPHTVDVLSLILATHQDVDVGLWFEIFKQDIDRITNKIDECFFHEKLANSLIKILMIMNLREEMSYKF